MTQGSSCLVARQRCRTGDGCAAPVRAGGRNCNCPWRGVDACCRPVVHTLRIVDRDISRIGDRPMQILPDGSRRWWTALRRDIKAKKRNFVPRRSRKVIGRA